jgi:hypothetical protein
MRKPAKQLKLVIERGQIRSIHDDALTTLFDGAEVVIRRASHVEPHQTQWGDGVSYWQADLSPVGGPILTGFKTRGEALDAELQYLQEHVVI